MAERKSVHKLKKASAYSFSLTIPKEIVEKYKWRVARYLARLLRDYLFCAILPA